MATKHTKRTPRTSKKISESPKVEKVLHEYKEGTLKSGKSDKKVTDRKQAIAIALSEARKDSGTKMKRKQRKAKK